MDSGQSTRMEQYSLCQEVTVVLLKRGRERWVCLWRAVEQASPLEQVSMSHNSFFSTSKRVYAPSNALTGSKARILGLVLVVSSPGYLPSLARSGRA